MITLDTTPMATFALDTTPMTIFDMELVNDSSPTPNPHVNEIEEVKARPENSLPLTLTALPLTVTFNLDTPDHDL